ncbi:membrane-bound PQQ-dependent dehydrogenase, glucose/quinate/shikimate family [bacterium]|nr:membrane-bound PQQ-dependent dehydrogenase, glucose/quinate/shikimate family [bacterium]
MLFDALPPETIFGPAAETWWIAAVVGGLFLATGVLLALKFEQIVSWLFAGVLAGTGAYLTLGGIQLIGLGGSFYYVAAGLVLIATAVLTFLKSPWAARLYAVFLVATLGWAVMESGLNAWALAPRLAMFFVLGLWFLAPWTQAALRRDDGASGGALWVGVAAALVAVVGLVAGLKPDPAATALPDPERRVPVETHTDWQQYGGTTLGQRFAQVDEITPANVHKLKEIWRVRSNVPGPFKVTPTQVGDLLYYCTKGNIITALDADTGEERWRHDPQVEFSGVPNFGETCRGVSYFKAPADYVGECAERLIVGTLDARLIAVDSRTGRACTSFGRDGSVNLKAGMGELRKDEYFITSPPIIAGDVVATSGWVTDNVKTEQASGVVRAFDAITGAYAWGWDMGRPNDTGQPIEGETFTRGTPNVWSIMSYDPALNLIYAPTGNGTPDYFGAHRTPEMEQYASSVVAIDADTGVPRWSFQTVHHDVWDWDVPSQPVLVDIPRPDGSIVPAVIQPTKRAEVFVLDRRDGTPIFPIEERPVPQDPVEGDWLSPTQPFTADFLNFRNPMGESRMWGATPLDQLWCRIAFRKLRWDGHFTPPGLEPALFYPGNAGGFNWGSVSVDAERGLLIAAPMIMANTFELITRDEIAAGRRASGQLGTPYGSTTTPFMNPFTQMPCAEPPYSRVSVVDLKTGQQLWNKPLGSARDSGPFGIRSHLNALVGTPLQAGPLTTKGGLIFHGGTMDRTLRAIDVATGKTVWRADLPANAQATPMSYRAPKSGRQIVVVTVSIPPSVYPRRPPTVEPDPEGGYLIAYALEE